MCYAQYIINTYMYVYGASTVYLSCALYIHGYSSIPAARVVFQLHDVMLPMSPAHKPSPRAQPSPAQEPSPGFTICPLNDLTIRSKVNINFWPTFFFQIFQILIQAWNLVCVRQKIV